MFQVFQMDQIDQMDLLDQILRKALMRQKVLMLLMAR
jgi:hypothetical protein